MRSYLETLLKYDSEFEYEKLMTKWNLYIKSTLGVKSAEFMSFQHQFDQSIILENSIYEQQFNLSQQNNIIFYNNYKKIIYKIEGYIDNSIKSILKGETNNWLLYKSEYKKNLKYGEFKLDRLFQEWININKQELPERIDRNYYKKYKSTCNGKILIDSVEQFYNFKKEKKGFELSSKTYFNTNEFDLLFRAKDDSINFPKQSYSWNEKRNSIIEFEGESNDNAELKFNNLSPIVTGKIRNVFHQKINFINWCNKDLMSLNIKKEQLPINEHLPHLLYLEDEVVSLFKFNNIIICEGLTLNVKFKTKIDFIGNINLIETKPIVFPFYIPRSLINVESISKKRTENEINIKLGCKKPLIIGRF